MLPKIKSPGNTTGALLWRSSGFGIFDRTGKTNYLQAGAVCFSTGSGWRIGFSRDVLVLNHCAVGRGFVESATELAAVPVGLVHRHEIAGREIPDIGIHQVAFGTIVESLYAEAVEVAIEHSATNGRESAPAAHHGIAASCFHHEEVAAEITAQYNSPVLTQPFAFVDGRLLNAFLGTGRQEKNRREQKQSDFFHRTQVFEYTN
jgi:hypothetical protein